MILIDYIYRIIFIIYSIFPFIYGIIRRLLANLTITIFPIQSEEQKKITSFYKILPESSSKFFSFVQKKYADLGLKESDLLQIDGSYIVNLYITAIGSGIFFNISTYYISDSTINELYLEGHVDSFLLSILSEVTTYIPWSYEPTLQYITRGVSRCYSMHSSEIEFNLEYSPDYHEFGKYKEFITSINSHTEFFFTDRFQKIHANRVLTYTNPSMPKEPTYRFNITKFPYNIEKEPFAVGADPDGFINIRFTFDRPI